MWRRARKHNETRSNPMLSLSKRELVEARLIPTPPLPSGALSA